jgi:hypothetical protein
VLSWALHSQEDSTNLLLNAELQSQYACAFPVLIDEAPWLSLGLLKEQNLQVQSRNAHPEVPSFLSCRTVPSGAWELRQNLNVSKRGQTLSLWYSLFCSR